KLVVLDTPNIYTQKPASLSFHVACIEQQLSKPADIFFGTNHFALVTFFGNYEYLRLWWLGDECHVLAPLLWLRDVGTWASSSPSERKHNRLAQNCTVE